MTQTRCVHGIDSRFCAICNAASRGALRQSEKPVDASLAEVLRFLNRARTRATYGAVASVLGVSARLLGPMLGTRRPEASWVVNVATGLPKDYQQADWHADLLATSAVIRTGRELALRLALWRAKP